jgi:hypothetical protein
MSRSRIPQAGSLEENWFSAIFIDDSASNHEKISFTNANVQGSAVPAGVSVARLVASKDCFVSYGSNPTAANTKMFLPAGVIEYFGVDPGKKFAAIRDTANGTLYISYGSSN